jgi:hypothetical protein
MPVFTGVYVQISDQAGKMADKADKLKARLRAGLSIGCRMICAPLKR